MLAIPSARLSDARRWLICLLLTLVSACSSDSGNPLGPGQPGELECDRAGYPCSMASVPIEVLRRSELLADSAAAMMRDGTATSQVRDWLAQREGVVEAQAGYDALRFRVTGSVPVWVMDDRVNTGGSSIRIDTRSGDMTALVAAPNADVVGDETDVKRALVLAPFAWQFTGYDESAAVAAILDDTRGYEGRVQYMQVATEGGAPIPLSVFTTWDLYDVVHVSSHGRTTCDGNVCRATLGIAFDNRPIEQVKADWSDVGVTFTVGLSGNRLISLGADFFIEHYKQGLDNVLVFLNACETLTANGTDLANAIRGSTGVYVGWSAAVPAGNARDAALAFYTRLADAGVTIGTAYNDLGDLKTIQWTDSDGITLSPTLRVTERAAGGDLRIRNIVWLENPAGGSPLADGARVGIIGTVGDGKADTIPYRIRIDGVDAPAGDFLVRVAIDGVTSAPATLSAAQSAGAMTRVLTGSLPMGRDLQDEETLTIRAWVELPDGGTSEASAQITVGGDPGYWVGYAAFVRDAGEDYLLIAEATNLRFDYNAGLNRYTLTHGTLTWTQTGRTLNVQGQICTYETPPQTIALAPGSGHIIINNATSPARYSLFGDYTGETFSVPTSCAGLSLPVRFNGAWLYSGRVKNISADGNTIEDLHVDDYGFLLEAWGWELVRQTG